MAVQEGKAKTVWEKWGLSTGDVIGMVGALVMVGVSYGLIRGDIQALREQAELARIVQSQRDVGQDDRMKELKSDMTDRLKIIDQKLDRLIERNTSH